MEAFKSFNRKLLLTWDSLQSSLWVFPFVIILLFLSFTFFFLESDKFFFTAIHQEGAEAVLSIIASSIFQAAAVLFSITMVALAFAANQYGSRLLRSFMSDRYNQFVIGYFGGLFIFCLIALQKIPSFESTFLVWLVNLASIFGIIAIFLLIYFIHHVCTSIQAPHLISKIGEDLFHLIEKMPSYDLEKKNVESPFQKTKNYTSFFVYAEDSGYVQNIFLEKLTEKAREYDLIIGVLVRPGNYVVKHLPVAKIYCKNLEKQKEIAKEFHKILLGSLSLGNESKPITDIEYYIRQLVELALRAVSPAINNQFSCTHCIDELMNSIFLSSFKAFPPSEIYDKEKKLRLVVKSFSFRGLVETAFDQIRQTIATTPSLFYITLYLIDSLLKASQHVSYKDRGRVLKEQIKLLIEMAEKNIDVLGSRDKEALEKRKKAFQELASLEES